MNYFLFLYFAAFMIYIWMIIYTLSKNPKAKLNIICSIIIFFIALWSFFALLHHSTSDKKLAVLWSNISSIGWISFSSFYLWFSIILTKKETIQKKWYFYFIFLIPIILIYMQWTGNILDYYTKQIYGWSGVWKFSIWSYLYYIYYISFIIISIFLIYKYGKKTKLAYEKKQAKLIVKVTIITLILGVVNDNLLSQILSDFIPSMGFIIILIWLGGMVYAITKYRLMVLTSSYAARDILSTMIDSLMLINPEGNIIEVNNTALNLFGYKKDEIIEKHISMLFTSEDIPLINTLFFNKNKDEIFLYQEQLNNRRMTCITKDNKEIPVEFYNTIMKEKRGEIIGIVCIFHDIRKIIKSEKQKEEIDKLKNDFITNITHDFRSPLTAILNLADLELKSNNYNNESLKVIYTASIRLKKSIDRLLEIAKIDALGIKLNIEKINPIKFLKRIIDFYSSSVVGSGIKVIGKFKEVLIDDFYSDKEKLEEIIDNILSNAIKFVDKDIGKITIDLLDKKESIVICIEDNGIGIPEDKLNVIFNRFEQVHEGRNSCYRGTGIGLAFAKQLVEILKGKLWAESEGEKKGSRFYIELKRGRNIYDEKDFINSNIKKEYENKIKNNRYDLKEIINSEIRNKNEKNGIIKIYNEINNENEYDYKKGIILIVDDDKIIREIVAKYLANNGYKNFILASDGKQAVEAIYENSPDLIICDYNMPNIKGDQLHNEIMDNPKFKEIPFIFLSAITDRNIMDERKEKGASAYLKKPIDEKDFILTVDFHLKKYFGYLKISQLATIDELTGLYNRRRIIDSLKHELLIRKYRDLSLVFIDIDHFKGINDSYGHPIGDLILMSIGEIIKNSIRGYDIAGRYGGDEFIIILPDTNLEDAKYVSEILREKIKKNWIEHMVEKIYINSSFGISSLKDNAKYIEKTLKIDSIENLYEIKNINEVDWEKINKYKFQISELLIKMADIALYKAKYTVCNKCGFNSEKSELFIKNKCPNCGNANLILGRNKVVGFE